MPHDEKIVELLTEIRDGQKEALAMQREHMEFVRSQFERTKAIQDRAEAIQEKSVWLVNTGAKTFKIVLPIIAFLIVLVIILMFVQGSHVR